MPKKKKKKSKTKTRKVSRKNKKVRKKTSKNTDNKDQELIIKTKSEWIKESLANKAQYTKKYNDSIKHNNECWAKEGKRIT